jgi:hypothetical protein
VIDRKTLEGAINLLRRMGVSCPSEATHLVSSEHRIQPAHGISNCRRFAPVGCPAEGQRRGLEWRIYDVDRIVEVIERAWRWGHLNHPTYFP